MAPNGVVSALRHSPEIRVSDLHLVYGGRHLAPRPALAGVDFVIPGGQFVSIIGASGCGKSTLLRLLGGLERPTAGTVHIAGHEPHTIRAAGAIGFVPQSPALLPWRTVADNVALLEQIGPWGTQRLDDEGLDRWLDRVELSAERNLLPHQLSGGMQQRVALARAFAIEPSLLLMDEPFSALDELTRSHMQDLVAGLCAETHATVVFVTHSIDEAVKLSDRVIVMGGAPGRIKADLPIDLARPRPTGVEDTADFRAYAATVRGHLVHTGASAP